MSTYTYNGDFTATLTLISDTDISGGIFTVPLTVVYLSNTYNVTAIGDGTNPVGTSVTGSYTVVFASTTNVGIINQHAFSNDTNLISITIPPPVGIVQQSFDGCVNLPYILVDDSSHINSYIAFMNALTTLTGSITSGTLTIFNSAVIATITYPIHLGIGSTAVNLGGITEIVIPTVVTQLSDFLFMGMTTLVTVTFTATSSIARIGISCFDGCIILSNIVIPPSVGYVGANSFADCASLTSFTLYTTGTININDHIDVNVWTGCGNLPYVFLNNNIQSVVIFLNAMDTTTASISGSTLTIKDTANITSVLYPIAYVGGNTTIMNTVGISTIILGNNVINIGSYAFSSLAGLTTFSFGTSNVTLIGELAFVTTSITSITIPASVSMISISVFAGCANLTSVTFADGSTLTSLAQSTFQNCSTLQTINIPASITDLGNYVFFQCPDLMTITFDGLTPPTSIGINVFDVPHSPLISGHLQPDAITSDWTSAFSAYSDSITFSGGSDPSACFLIGTKILCLDLNTKKDTYIPIECLKIGDLVKTISSGYQPIIMIGRDIINNEISPDSHGLYVLFKNKYRSLIDNLYLTASHSILVTRITHTEKESIEKLVGKIYVTDNRFRLMACCDKKAEPYRKKGLFVVYHLALKHLNDGMNYGIYANGLLVESISKTQLENSGMNLIK